LVNDFVGGTAGSRKEVEKRKKVESESEVERKKKM